MRYKMDLKHVSLMMIIPLALCAAACSDDDAAMGIKLNEIQASNPDDDDWLELYNNSDEEVSLAGVELRDSNRFWTFAGGKLAARAFLKVVCDGKNKAGSTNFKLSSSGERLTILDKSGNKLDSLVFPALRSKTSWGRIPDGDGNWTALGNPTPGKTNMAGAPADLGPQLDSAVKKPDAGTKKPDAGTKKPDAEIKKQDI